MDIGLVAAVPPLSLTPRLMRSAYLTHTNPLLNTQLNDTVAWSWSVSVCLSVCLYVTTVYCGTVSKQLLRRQEAQLLQRDRATHCQLNLVKCCTNVQKTHLKWLINCVTLNTSLNLSSITRHCQPAREL